MSRLLRSPGLAAEPRSVGVADPALDLALQAAVEQAAAEAYERGRRDGAAAASAAAEEAGRRLVAAVRRAASDLAEVAARADVGLAFEIARLVLGGEPPASTAALLERVTASLAALDEEEITVHVNPRDRAGIAGGLAAATRGSGVAVEVVADSDIPAGEAQLAGRWARADLTRAGALEAVRELLAREGFVAADAEEAGRAA